VELERSTEISFRLHSSSDLTSTSKLNAPSKVGTPPRIFTSLLNLHIVETVNMAAVVEIIDQLKANLSHGAIATNPDSENYDMSPGKEMVDNLKATLSHGATVVTPDSDNYAESFKRWSAAAEKNPVSLNLPHSSLSSEL